MHHWYSTFTGEIVKDFPELVINIVRTLAAYKNRWSISDKVKSTVCWRYSKVGF